MNTQKFQENVKISISNVKLDYFVLFFSYTLVQPAIFVVYCKLPSSKELSEKTNSRNLTFTLTLTLLYVFKFFAENENKKIKNKLCLLLLIQWLLFLGIQYFI